MEGDRGERGKNLTCLVKILTIEKGGKSERQNPIDLSMVRMRDLDKKTGRIKTKA